MIFVAAHKDQYVDILTKQKIQVNVFTRLQQGIPKACRYFIPFLGSFLSFEIPTLLPATYLHC